jgi:hypothetical protein
MTFYLPEGPFLYAVTDLTFMHESRVFVWIVGFLKLGLCRSTVETLQRISNNMNNP